MSEWQTTDTAPENVVVATKIDDACGVRNEQPLKRRGNLWFFPDDSMYVYYTPTHWKQYREFPWPYRIWLDPATEKHTVYGLDGEELDLCETRAEAEEQVRHYIHVGRCLGDFDG